MVLLVMLMMVQDDDDVMQDVVEQILSVVSQSSTTCTVSLLSARGTTRLFGTLHRNFRAATISSSGVRALIVIIVIIVIVDHCHQLRSLLCSPFLSGTANNL